MSYTPHNFVNGEIIEAEPINEMDRQIQTNETNIGLKLDKSDVYNGLDYTEEGKALDARQGRALNQAVGGKISSTEKGAANGVAELDSTGKVPSSQLPSYVDDIIEGYYYNGKFYKEAAHTTEITGETGKIYVDLASEKTYRWGGSEYVEISASLALGETSSTAYRGDRGKAAYDHATDANRLTTAQTEGLYKVATTAEGHIKSVSAVEKSDIMALGIPGSQPDVSGKADKVSDPTSGNFAGLDENGNLTDSGKKPSDFLTQHQDISGKADKDTDAVVGNFAAFDSNGNPVDSGHKHSDYITSHQDISGKADKVSGATNGNFAGLDSNGNLTDSGSKASDFLTQHQDISGKADKVTGATAGNFAGLDSNGNLTDSGHKSSDYLAASLKGANGGVAELDQSGTVPAAQLPPDILEYESYSEFPATGEAGKIYVDTSTNIIYRWNGTRYVAISSSGGGGGGISVDDIPFTIATTDWVAAVGGGYTATVSSAAISSLSKEIVLYDSSIKQLSGDIVATKDAENSSMIFKTTSIPSGTISGDIYSFTDVGSARAVFKDIQFSIAVADWTGVSAPYTAQILDSFVTEDSGVWVFFDDSYDSYAGGAVWAAVNSDGTGIAFSTDIKPTGTITGFVRVVDGVSGTIPVSLGGTGATSIEEACENLGAVPLAQKGVANGVATLDGSGLVPSSQLPGATQSVAGLMSAADKTKLDGVETGATANVVSDSLSDTSTTNALSAAQGKALNDKISKIGTSAVQLWNGNLMLDDEVTLSESMANFNFILLHFLTNSEHSYQLVPSSNFVGGEVISQTIMANSSSGQVSYPLAYNSSIQVKATSATKVKCIASNYNNVNYIVKLRNVYGVMRIS